MVHTFVATEMLQAGQMMPVALVAGVALMHGAGNRVFAMGLAWFALFFL